MGSESNFGPFAVLGQEEGQAEEGRATAPSATRLGRGQTRSGGPRTRSASASLPGPRPGCSRKTPRDIVSLRRPTPSQALLGSLPGSPTAGARDGAARLGCAPGQPPAGPRRGCRAARPPPALTILQMEAMFLTVISLKVAAIPHRHLYKVKTAPLMVGRAQEGIGGGGGSCSRAGIKARGGDCTGTLCARRAARRTDLPGLPPPGE